MPAAAFSRPISRQTSTGLPSILRRWTATPCELPTFSPRDPRFPSERIRSPRAIRRRLPIRGRGGARHDGSAAARGNGGGHPRRRGAPRRAAVRSFSTPSPCRELTFGAAPRASRRAPGSWRPAGVCRPPTSLWPLLPEPTHAPSFANPPSRSPRPETSWSLPPRGPDRDSCATPTVRCYWLSAALEDGRRAWSRGWRMRPKPSKRSSRTARAARRSCSLREAFRRESSTFSSTSHAAAGSRSSSTASPSDRASRSPSRAAPDASGSGCRAIRCRARSDSTSSPARPSIESRGAPLRDSAVDGTIDALSPILAIARVLSRRRHSERRRGDSRRTARPLAAATIWRRTRWPTL